jgi:hypothetical protein
MTAGSKPHTRLAAPVGSGHAGQRRVVWKALVHHPVGLGLGGPLVGNVPVVIFFAVVAPEPVAYVGNVAIFVVSVSPHAKI